MLQHDIVLRYALWFTKLNSSPLPGCGMQGSCLPGLYSWLSKLVIAALHFLYVSMADDNCSLSTMIWMLVLLRAELSCSLNIAQGYCKDESDCWRGLCLIIRTKDYNQPKCDKQLPLLLHIACRWNQENIMNMNGFTIFLIVKSREYHIALASLIRILVTVCCLLIGNIYWYLFSSPANLGNMIQWWI